MDKLAKIVARLAPVAQSSRRGGSIYVTPFKFPDRAEGGGEKDRS